MAINIKKNIFISYRVKDTQLATGRLVDALKQHIHENRIFMDIDKIDPGLDFTQVIAKYLNSCEVMLAIIGPNWRAYNPEKQSYRINDANDWVRKEIASALQRDIRVIPILLDGGTIPEEDELPEDLKPLVLRQAYEISNTRWKYDCDQLIETLQRTLGGPLQKENLNQTNQDQKLKSSYDPKHTSTTSKTKKYWIIAAVIFALVIVVQVFNSNSPKISPNPIPTDYSQPIPPLNNTPQPAIESPKNIAGKWFDPNGQGTYVISQDGQQLSLQIYAIAGEQTGSGTGYLSGNKVTLQATIYLAGTAILCEFDLNLSNQDRELQGSIKIEQNGAAYSEKLHLEKQ